MSPESDHRRYLRDGIEATVARLVAEAPPLTAEQRERLAYLLRPFADQKPDDPSQSRGLNRPHH